MSAPATLRALAPLLLLATAAAAGEAAVPVRLSPANPRYLEFRGVTRPLIGSGEHYGALVNPDFDHRRYFAELARHGLGHVRLFAGTYVEAPDSFAIERNTLAPDGARFLCPFARSPVPGYAGGGAKFDLDRWDDAWFARAREVLAEAGRAGVVVELCLFCVSYRDEEWDLSPLKADNNVNGIGAIPRERAATLDNGGLLAVQEALARKLATELNGFDNLYWEVCNEPYVAPGAAADWQQRIAEVIVDAEAALPSRHLIAFGIANGAARVDPPPAHAAVLDFHYASPPDAVALNRDLPLAVADAETGFRGRGDAPYRMEAWDFVLAGGAVFSHLDFSFAVGSEDGSFAFTASPGGGGEALRAQLGLLARIAAESDVAGMTPSDDLVVGGAPPGRAVRLLARPGERYLAYLRRLPSDVFAVRWTGTLTSAVGGVHALRTVSDDGIRVRIDGRPLIERWTDHARTEDLAEVELEAGRAHDLVVEYYQRGGGAVVQLAWTPPGATGAIVPAAALRGHDGEPGLEATYFASPTFSDEVLRRRDATIDFDWSAASPLPPPTGEAVLRLAIPAGSWWVEWIDPVDGPRGAFALDHAGGALALDVPAFADDLALRITPR